MLEVWLVRHGETDWNKERRLQGWTDIPLNDTGHSQAMKLSKHLEGVPFRHIYTSDLCRARHTAEPIQCMTGAPLTVDARLRERRFGAEEGSIRQESTNPSFHTHDARANGDTGGTHDTGTTHDAGVARNALGDGPLNAVNTNDTGDHRTLGREPHAELMTRLQSFFHDVCRKHHKGRIIAVTHGGVIRSILSSFGITTDHPIENTGVCRLRYDGDTWSVCVINAADHLR